MQIFGSLRASKLLQSGSGQGALNAGQLTLSTITLGLNWQGQASISHRAGFLRTGE